MFIPEGVRLPGLNDSKQLTRDQRERLFDLIQQSCRFGIAWADPEEIEQRNILWASLAAIVRAAHDLPEGELWIDGNQTPRDCPRAVRTIVKGDAKIAAIAAASVLAKVSRDRYMTEANQRFPGYGFADHFGYGTPPHLAALRALGPCPLHRRSFAPVAELLAQPSLFE